MKKLFLAIAAFILGAINLNAAGWPANYQGVMLQGFYWDSYKGSNTTKWADLTGKADELSKYFTLIWVPNCSRANGENGGGNGYMPIYWFTNQNCAYGTESQLKTMISTFKSKGVGLIEDVVINHRVGVSNWADFPAEQWNGKTWQLKSTDVCSTDEWSGGPKGGPDTGEDFGAARDLDHNSTNVQENCKAYCQFLLQDLGFVGFRLDMVKGYAGKFTKMYNQASKPQFSVGEYWDGSYDAVTNWINATGKESAAFDFPFKYAVNKCFNGGAHNYSELVWKANGTTDQPAGLIHYGYSQYAVTFVDNHDTYRDDSKMTGDVLQANAFMLSSPGTPCVFWPHYTQYKSQIQAMIDARNGAGIHNNSPVKVLEVNANCYVAEVTGTKGKLWIKLGNSSRTAGSGYTKKAYGNGYEIWTTSDGGDNPGQNVTIYFRNTVNWATPTIHYWGASESTWPGVAMAKVKDDVYKYVCPAGTTGIIFNAGDGDATKTNDFVAVNNHIYTTAGDQGEYKGEDPGPDPQPTGDYYLIGHFSGTADWVPGSQVAMTRNGDKYVVTQEITDAGEGKGYYGIVTNNSSSWDGDDATPGINSTDRYGAETKDYATTVGTPMKVTKFAAGVNASSAFSWYVTPGNYSFTFDPSAMTLTVSKATGIDEMSDYDDETPAVWFNLQGVRVSNPQNGVFIRVKGKKAQKVVID